MARIFIVEDDAKIREELMTLLEKYGHVCFTSDDFSAVIDHILQSGPELVLLDLNLPVYDGYHVCRELRRVSSLPIIVVTSRDSDVDELMSMNLGADDFITKPYNTQILLARINSVLMRTYNSRTAKVVTHNGVTLDLATSIVSSGEKQAELTKNELRILHLLMSSSGSVIGRDELMNDLWQSDEFVDDNTLTVNINRLRKKLEEIGVTGYLVTKRGRGYMV